MCDVTYIGVYTYLHGRYFLSAPYNDIICLASPHSTLLFVFSDSSSHVCATSRNSPPHTQSNITLPAEIQRAPYFLVQRTHTTLPWFSLGRPILRMFYFQSTELGRNWTWLPLEMPLAVTFSSCEWIINLRTRISWNFLCIILLPRDL